MDRRIEVRRDALVAAIKARREEARREHAKAVEAYPAKVKAWQAAATKILNTALVTVDRAGTFKRSYIELPSKPTRPILDTSVYDRNIATLEMAVKDTIVISAEDYARYVR